MSLTDCYLYGSKGGALLKKKSAEVPDAGIPDARIIATVAEIASPVVENLGFDYIATEYVIEDGEHYLRILADKTGGITIDDCSIISEALDNMIENTGLIDRNYIFEVSSPGIDRPLKTARDFERYKGQKVEVVLKEPYDGRTEYTGELAGHTDGGIGIILDTKPAGKAANKEKEEKIGIFNIDDFETVKRIISFG